MDLMADERSMGSCNALYFVDKEIEQRDSRRS